MRREEVVFGGVQFGRSGVPEPRGGVARALPALVGAPAPLQDVVPLLLVHGHHALADLVARVRERVHAVEGFGAALVHPIRGEREARRVLLDPLFHLRVLREVAGIVLLARARAPETHGRRARAVASVVRAPLPRHARRGRGHQALATRAGVIVGTGEFAIHARHAVVPAGVVGGAHDGVRGRAAFAERRGALLGRPDGRVGRVGVGRR
mmetsp:Transcript_3804/g.16125  ORF Transcript_3804/g.16125 Transcript_3804/m.16125 type:complete len:209 (+) Transcript_3804:801-1427(+)